MDRSKRKVSSIISFYSLALGIIGLSISCYFLFFKPAFHPPGATMVTTTVSYAVPKGTDEASEKLSAYDYEEWIHRFFHELAQLHYREKQTMTLKSEHVRLIQHTTLAQEYLSWVSFFQQVQPPDHYVLLHDLMKEEIWLSALMHEHYIKSFAQFKQFHYEKTLKHYQWLMHLEKEHTKMLYRWLLQERSNYQSNIQDK